MGWMDEYEDGGQFSGLTNKGFNYNGAWGGPAQNGRKIVKESTAVVKPKINLRELKNIISDYKEEQTTDDLKKPRAEANKMQKHLPNKNTKTFFNKIYKEAGYPIYKNALRIQNQRGNPVVNVGTNKGLPFAVARNYNPFTNEVNIPKSNAIEFDLDNYIKEVSHAGQPTGETIVKWLANDLPAYAREKMIPLNSTDNLVKRQMASPYETKGTVENYTHRILEPELREQLLKPITSTKYQGGGSMPGSVGFSYARTGAPSNGKYAKKTMPSAEDGLEIIEDDMGQWAHPGKITKINSNRITMKNVDYPVIGVSDTGDKKLMKPGRNYKFKGRSVTEYPVMAQSGNSTDFISQWTNSPQHLEMLKKSAPYDYKKILKERKKNINSTKVNYYDRDSSIPRSLGGESDDATGEVRIFEEDPYEAKNIELHERSHSSDRFSNVWDAMTSNQLNVLNDKPGLEYKRNIPYADVDLIKRSRPYNKKQMPINYQLKKLYDEHGVDVPKEELRNKYDSNWIDYISRPTETRARLNELRKRALDSKIYNPLKEKITPEQYQLLLENPEIMRGSFNPLIQLKTIYEDDEIIKMLNSISAKENKEASLPIAKDGNQLIKLDQLTNFTNYNKPQPGGWLDNL